MSRGLRYASMDVLPEKLRQRIAQEKSAPVRTQVPDCAGYTKPLPQPAPRETPKRKYHNHPVTVDGIRFDSKKEAAYYQQLKLRQAAGEVSYWLHQVPIRLPGGTRYVVDFQVHLADGRVLYVDVKGRETQVFRVKKREIEHHYPLRILLA